MCNYTIQLTDSCESEYHKLKKGDPKTLKRITKGISDLKNNPDMGRFDREPTRFKISTYR